MNLQRILLMAALATGTLLPLHATDKDSLRVVNLEEVTIIATPKEHKQLRQLPATVSLIGQDEMQAAHVTSIKRLASLVPNLYIPDYGSSLTSAIYIRGIGSRINTPSVGLYVDNVPYIDKSAFDFNFYDIERIDVLRGPQGTLYGRNTMAGLVRVHTRSPFSYQGTDIKLGAATHGGANASVTHYHRISPKFAFSAGGHFEHSDGYFKNVSTGARADALNAAGGRMRGIWLPTDNTKVDLSVSFDRTKQDGYPYAHYDTETGKVGDIDYTDPASYRRSLFNTGLTVEHQAQAFTFTAVTGVQHLRDRMLLDQDFSPADIFTIMQRQRLTTVSEEVVFKSRAGNRWQWTTGAFGFYQNLHTDGPVQFKEDGMKTMIEDNVNRIFSALPPNAPAMSLGLTSTDMGTTGTFSTPVVNLALFHESTIDDFLLPNLSLTAGLRLDYEKMHINYTAGADVLKYNFNITVPGMPRPIALPISTETPVMDGRIEHDYLQLLPRLALKYNVGKRGNVYASLSKGYRSGGYNVQMFSDLIQGSLAGQMVTDVKATTRATMLQMPGMTEERVDAMLSLIPDMTAGTDVKQAISYKPEFTWNVELGTHLNLFDDRLQADVAAFAMFTRDQQIARFAQHGFGRMTVNAGRSRSLGVEASLRAALTARLSANVSYGLTHAVFTDYDAGSTGSGANAESVSYDGKRVPFVPRHTLNASLTHTTSFAPAAFIDRLSATVGFNGAGRIYWTEANDISQPFYGTLNARIGVQRGMVELDCWVQNILDEKYTTFYFESLGSSLAQQGRPVHAGVDVRLRF